MALKKTIIAPNGVELNYHRIVMITTEVNQRITILVHSYIGENGRNYEKNYAQGLIEGQPTFPYVSYEYVTAPYNEDMNIKSAYEWLKTQEKYLNSEDI